MASEARVRTDPRFRRRRAAVLRSKRKRLVLGGAASLAVATLVWGMFWSPLLVVRDVRVQGTKNADPDEVVAATRLIGANENLLRLSSDEIEARVEQLPWVKRAAVERMLPGSVRVKVTERTPALVLSIGAARWTLDAQGNVLGTGAARKGLPVLAGIEVGDVEPGIKLLTPEATNAMQVLRGLPRSLRKKVAGLFAPTSERITLSLQDGTVVRFGAAERVRAKVKVLRVLLRRVAARGMTAAYVDVRVPTNPAISSAGPAVAGGGSAL